MQELIQAFVLGNGAILTNVCLLPLYPGLVAFLAGNTRNEAARQTTVWLGFLVLAGVLSMMMLVGLMLFLLNQSFGAILPWLLPIIYALVILFGLLMLFGFNPFQRLSTGQIPMLKNSQVTAYLYGLVLGPMTLPCTGPFFLSGVLLSATSLSSLLDGLAYFLVFGLGFGWPLLVLPFFALPLQRRATSWLGRNYQWLTRASGILLLAIGVYGIWTEVLPNL
jgi:cytochrome c-type biogenesis protein